LSIQRQESLLKLETGEPLEGSPNFQQVEGLSSGD
jgi:hypothetical protein